MDGASDTLRWRVLHGGTGRSLDDGLRALRVMVTALVQRAACECSDACQCCQLPANALCAASRQSGGAAPSEFTNIYICFIPALLLLYFNVYIYRYTYFNVYVYIYIYNVQVKGYIR